jgi:hypothetical protein
MPGESGNPTGSNRPKRLASLLRQAMAQPSADDPGKTVGTRFIEEVILTAVRTGNAALIRELWDRHDGKVPEPDMQPEDMTSKTNEELLAIARGKRFR